MRVKGILKTRHAIANLAAKYITVDGINNFLTAKYKAAEKLGYSQPEFLPNNKEIEQAIISYQNLFQQDTQPEKLYTLRQHALDVMKIFRNFNPYLVGPVLSGTATEYSEISICIYTDAPEEVSIYLMENRIEFSDIEYKLKLHNLTTVFLPAFRFLAGTSVVILIVLSPRQSGHSPISSIDGKPMERANISRLQTLLESENY